MKKWQKALRLLALFVAISGVVGLSVKASSENQEADGRRWFGISEEGTDEIDTFTVVEDEDTFYYFNELEDSLGLQIAESTYSLTLDDGTKITGDEVEEYIDTYTTQETLEDEEGENAFTRTTDSITVIARESFNLQVETTLLDDKDYAYTRSLEIYVRYIPTGLAVTSSIWNEAGQVTGWDLESWDELHAVMSQNIYDEIWLQFVTVEVPQEGAYDQEGNLQLEVTPLDVSPEDLDITYDSMEASVNTQSESWEEMEEDVWIQQVASGEDGNAPYYKISLRHTGTYEFDYDGGSVTINSRLPGVGIYGSEEMEEESLLNSANSTLEYEPGSGLSPSVYVYTNPCPGWNTQEPEISLSVEKTAHEEEDFSSFYTMDGSKITLTDEAYGNFTLVAKISVTWGEGEDWAWTEEYQWSVKFSSGDVPSFEDSSSDSQCGFSALFIPEDAYKAANLWEVDREFDYWVHGETMQDVIDKLLQDAAEGKTLTDETTGKTYTVKNTGYIWTTVSYNPFVEEYLANGTAPQYVTTPSGDDGIKGIVMASDSQYYCAPLTEIVDEETQEEDQLSQEDEQQEDSEDPEDGTSQKTETRFCPVIDFINESDLEDRIFVAEYGWDEDNQTALYRYLDGDYENGFTLSEDENQYSQEDLLGMGYRIARDSEQTWLECRWPEVHMDAATPVKVISSFQDSQKDDQGNPKANLYLGMYKDSDIVSTVAVSQDTLEDGITITAKDIGQGVQKSQWYNVYVTAQELTCQTKTQVTEDGFLQKDSLDFETETGGKSLRDKLDIQSIVGENEPLKKALLTGTPLEVSLLVKSVDVSDTSFATQIDAIASYVKQNDGDMQLQYLDMGLEYKADIYTGKVSETAGQMEIGIKLPESFISSGKIPVVYRYHNGQVEKISSIFDDGRISFQTDCFSLYAIGVEKTTQTALPSATQPAAQPTAQATASPSASVTDLPGTTEEKTTKVKIGDTKVKGGITYKVTSVGDNKKTVACVKGNAKAKNVTIPATVTVGGTKCTVTSIKAKAFAGSKKLTSVTIAKTVTTIGKNAFKNCTALRKVTIQGTKIKKIGRNAFQNIAETSVIKVPGTKQKSYQALLKASGCKDINLKKM